MNPLQALDLLDNIVAQVSLPRNEHLRLQQAVITIRAALTPKPTPRRPKTRRPSNQQTGP